MTHTSPCTKFTPICRLCEPLTQFSVLSMTFVEASRA